MQTMSVTIALKKTLSVLQKGPLLSTLFYDCLLPFYRPVIVAVYKRLSMLILL